MDPTFLSRVLGKCIKITLKCGSFQGVLQHVDPSRAILLSKVEILTQGEEGTLGETSGVQSTNGGAPSLETSETQNEGLGCSSREHPNTSWNILKHDIAGHEEEVEYTVIDQFQQKFGHAIRHLKSQNVIGVDAEGVNLCRHGKLCWLQVATRSTVYLFDIFVLGARAFTNGLQMVFEDKGILKVIHDCRWLSDCLSHQYGTVLTNVFDTQVADVFMFSVKTGGFLPDCVSTLKDSLVRHLGMSPSQTNFFEYNRQQDIHDELDIWFVRPTPPSLLKVLALKAVYLLPLRSVLMDEMMSDYTYLVDAYINTYRDGEPNQLPTTAFSCMKLPEQLRHLSVWQKLRREKASEEFQINAEGLLTRSKKSRIQKTSDNQKSKGYVQGSSENSAQISDCCENPCETSESLLPPCPILEKCSINSG
ncbi:piRNA biogenesis protein EXD1 isoform X2 [Lissotriton helveticus]